MAESPSDAEREPPAWQLEEARKLRALWDARQKRPGKLSQAKFGELYGLGRENPQATVWQLLRGLRPLNVRAARAFADYLGVRVEEFSPRLAEELRQSTVTEESGTYRVPRALRGVPVVGTAQLGREGYWFELEHPVGHGEGRVKYESEDENAYAVRVVGDSMFPRIKSGEFVIVEPNHPIRPGDEVLVVTIDGMSMVKEFLFERDGIVHLENVNRDHPRVTLPRAQIAKMHYVQGVVKSSTFIPE